MFWRKNKSSINDAKIRFEHLLMIANKLPQTALPNLLRAIIRPTQSDFLLAVAEEGTDARPNLNESWLFFKDIYQLLDIEQMRLVEKDKNDFPLSLAIDMVLPWPWNLSRYIDNLSFIGNNNGRPWKQDFNNHRVTVWLPWKIGFVGGGNHSIMTGILAGEGIIIPDHVYDMSYLFETIRTDGIHWYVNGQKKESVRSWRHAAFFEIGRLLTDY
ncbi:hypothetical protein AB0856_003980 (plasmid) [Xenorhabdus stockiae]